MGQQMTMIDWMNWLDRGNQPNYFVIGRSGAGKLFRDEQTHHC